MGFTHFDKMETPLWWMYLIKRSQKEQLMQEGLFKSIMRLLNI